MQCLSGRRHDEASGLVARMAAFTLFAHAYTALPYEEIVKPQLVNLLGGNGRLMHTATKEVQGLSCSDEKLAEAAREARAAALAAAAALVTASQSQEKFFTAALSAPGAPWRAYACACACVCSCKYVIPAHAHIYTCLQPEPTAILAMLW